MAFLHFTTTPKGEYRVVGVYGTHPLEGVTPEEPNVILEYDLDLSTETIESLTLSDDKTSVVMRFPGKTLAEQNILLAEEAKELRKEYHIEHKKDRIKTQVWENLELQMWRMERAEEQDLLEGVNTRRLKVAQFRQGLRDANNAKEAEFETFLAGNPTVDEVEAWDEDWSTPHMAGVTLDF